MRILLDAAGGDLVGALDTLDCRDGGAAAIVEGAEGAGQGGGDLRVGVNEVVALVVVGGEVV